MRTVTMLGWCSVFVAALAAPASAQTWPADGEWRVLFCAGAPASDPLRDQPGATNERDVVGDAASPALYVFLDADFLYFRMRVDADPGSAGELAPFGWAVELDSDGDRRTYELLGMVDGITTPDSVVLGRNTAQIADDPADRYEQEIASYDAATHARALLAEGEYASSFGGTSDYFVDWALPLADLEAEGVLPETELVLVMGTSQNTQSIDADLACHDGASGEPRLSAAATDVFRPDASPVADGDGDGLSDEEELVIGTSPTEADSDGDGFTDGEEVRAGSDPNDPNSVPGEPSPSGIGVRGGPGGWCAASAAAPQNGGVPIALLAAVCLACRRRRARRRVATSFDRPS